MQPPAHELNAVIVSPQGIPHLILAAFGGLDVRTWARVGEDQKISGRKG